jgi:hypothetical protein
LDALQFLGVFFGVQLLFLVLVPVVPAAIVIARARSASGREPAGSRPESAQRPPGPRERDQRQRYLTDEDVELVAILQAIEGGARR